MRAIVMFIFFLMYANVSAFEWHRANEIVVAWDPVTIIIDLQGAQQPVPADNTIKYKVFIRNDNNDVAELGETADLQYNATFDIEGKYHIGVQALRYKDAEMLSSSSISWSDNQEVAPDPFGLKFFLNPGRSKNLRTQ